MVARQRRPPRGGARRQGPPALPPPRVRVRRPGASCASRSTTSPSTAAGWRGGRCATASARTSRLRAHPRGGVPRRALLRHGAARAPTTSRANGRTTAHSSNTWGPLPPALVLPLRPRRDRVTSARASRRSATPSHPWSTTDGDHAKAPATSPAPASSSSRACAATRARSGSTARRSPTRSTQPELRRRGAVDGAGLRPAARARRRDARAVARRRRRSSTSRTSSRARPRTSCGAAAPSSSRPRSRPGMMGRTPDYLNVTFACFAGARRRVGAARQRAGRGEPRRLPEGDARPRPLDDAHAS